MSDDDPTNKFLENSGGGGRRRVRRFVLICSVFYLLCLVGVTVPIRTKTGARNSLKHVRW